jgi:uracil-DNA glycosylase
MLGWKQLYEECAECHKCSLGDNRTHMVFGEGNIKAKIMFIGEAPGADEDRTGKPFVGRAGQLLTKGLTALDLLRDRDYYICNICKCRPENNRTPVEEEANTCISYLRNQVALVKPRIIVSLGATSMKYIIGGDMSATGEIINEWKITRDRGKWIERKGFLMMATFHPSAILRDESKKKIFWEDLKSIKGKYEKISTLE